MIIKTFLFPITSLKTKDPFLVLQGTISICSLLSTIHVSNEKGFHPPPPCLKAPSYWLPTIHLKRKGKQVMTVNKQGLGHKQPYI